MHRLAGRTAESQSRLDTLFVIPAIFWGPVRHDAGNP